MTYKEIARKYTIGLSDISIAVNKSRLKPTGLVKSIYGRNVRTWDEKQVVMAVAELMQARAKKHRNIANEWDVEAARLVGEIMP